MKQQLQNNRLTHKLFSSCRRALLAAVAGSSLLSAAFAADFEILADTPWAFRANFTGVDTDPFSLGDGNDFDVLVTDFWTVLVNLRGDSVDDKGNAFGFYEIQLTHSGNKVPNPLAPTVNTYLYYGPLSPGTILVDDGVASKPAEAGQELLTTTVAIGYDGPKGVVSFAGTIAGDSDLDGDSKVDSIDTDEVVKDLQGPKNAGIIKGREMGQIIKQTQKFVK